MARDLELGKYVKGHEMHHRRVLSKQRYQFTITYCHITDGWCKIRPKDCRKCPIAKEQRKFFKELTQ